jgi:hypothetical protein
VKASKRPDILPRQPSSSVDLRQFQRLGNELEILAFLQAAHTFAVESLEVERAHESAEGDPPALGPLYFVLIIHSTYNLGHWSRPNLSQLITAALASNARKAVANGR